MKVVHIDELSTTEQRIAPGTARRAATRRHSAVAARRSKCSDRPEILTACTSQQKDQVS